MKAVILSADGRKHVLACPRDPMPEPLCGGKAAGLSRLAAAGLPVPPFVCLTTGAYGDHLASLMPAGLDPAEVRRRILSAPLPAAVRASLSEAFRALGSGPLAVRSSATVEDQPGHSFAGQYETVLGVRDLEALEAAVKTCWASLWSDRARAYRARAGLGGRDAAMAVVLQVLVPADAAGILFTAEPMTRRPDLVVVESVRGTGEALAGGRVAPDRYVLRSPALRFLSLPAGPRSLSPGQARRLARLARRAESRLGGPLDMEWARRGDGLFFLQARPMTGKAARPGDLQVWSNLNTAEVMPQVITPSTWSLVLRLQDRMFRRFFAEFGQDVDRAPVVGLVGGRVYFNLSVVAGLLRSIPLITPKQIDALLGGAQADPSRRIEAIAGGLPEGGIPHFKASPLRWAARLLKIVLGVLLATPSRVEQFGRSLGAQAARSIRRDLGPLDLPDLLSIFREAVDRLISDGKVLLLGGSGLAWFEHLCRFTKARLGDESGILAQRLVAGTGGVESAEAGFDLWRLAARLRGEPEVLRVVRESGDPDEWRSRLEGSRAGRKFLREWGRFLMCHGHRAMLELELAEPRWGEAPAPVARALRGYLEDLEGTDPARRHDRLAAERAELVRGCLSQLGNIWLRPWFRFLVRRASAALRLRENLKSAAMVQMAFLRRLLLELGRRFSARRLLDAADDVFFLAFDEVEALVQRPGTLDARPVVRERRRERERHGGLRPPSVVVGRWEPGPAPAPEAPPGRILKGIGIFPGVVTGPARVMLGEGDPDVLKPGEILVAPFTNPGWAPIMVTAAAMVVDIGGILSHGSIVAREYGIPTVVNVIDATRVLRTGQRVRVDGALGSVQILD